MGYQFIHIEGYSREASSQKKGGGWSVKKVLAEVKRESGNCGHVDNPEPPKILLGNLEEIEQKVNEWADSMTDTKGRKLRKDALCMVGGVISLPRAEEKNWPAFKKHCLKWLREKYGEELKAVVEHQDEAHPHLHFYVVPKLGARFETIHEGKNEAQKVKNEGKLKGEQNTAYKEAMRGLQDRFFREVGEWHGLTRLGPKKRRLTRAQWQAEQTQGQALAHTLRKSKALKKKYAEAARGEVLATPATTGEKVGAFFAGAISRWHSPTLKVQEEAAAASAEAEKTKKELEKVRKEQRDFEKKIRAEADLRVSKISDQLALEKSRRVQSEKELDRAEQKLQELTPEPPLHALKNPPNFTLAEIFENTRAKTATS